MRGAKLMAAALASSWLSIGVGQAAEGLPSIVYKPDIDPQAFLPISYQCPAGRDGNVEIVKMSSVGGRVRTRVSFKGETVTHAAVERAWPNKSFEAWHEFSNPQKRPDTDADRELRDVILADAEAVRMAICAGVPATREKYDKILEYNRQHLKPPPQN